MLGDTVEAALQRVGVTSTRIEEWLGTPCHCEERKHKLNLLDNWARGVIQGSLHRAKEILLGVIES